MPFQPNILIAALLIVASELMFASMGAAVKAVSAELPSEVVVFIRNALGMLILLPLLARRGSVGFRTQVAHLHALRALAGVGAMYCFFFVLARLPLADAMLLKMTAPIFMPLLAFLWLSEALTRLALWAVPVGLIGVMLVLKPEGAVNWLALIGVLGGLLAALAKVTVRRLTRTEPTSRVVFYFAVGATLVAAVPMSWAWQMPSTQAWGLLLLMAAAGTCGQLLLTRGYALAPTARVSPFTYFSVVFAALYGYLFWGERLDLAFVVGAALIAFAGMLALRGHVADEASREALSMDKLRWGESRSSS